MSDYMTVKDVASLYGVSPQLVSRWIHEGHLRAHWGMAENSPGRLGYCILISANDLDDFDILNEVRGSRILKKLDRAERERFIGMQDLEEERRHDDACLIAEMRELFRKYGL